MTDETLLLSWLQEWRDWTLTETQALRGKDWERVVVCQHAKQQLRSRPQLSTRLASGAAAEPVRRLADELIHLETSNRQWLAGQTADLEARLSELKGSARNLTRLRGSYAGNQESHWQSYS